MQKELSNSGSNLGKARFVDGQHRSTPFLELAHQAPDLGRFPTRFASLKGDKQTGHALADKPAGPETQQRNIDHDNLSQSDNPKLGFSTGA
jgi:hypothetical protein